MTASTTTSLRTIVGTLMGQARADLADLVAFRSVADPALAPPEECEQAAGWVIDKFAELGLRDMAAARTPDGSLCVYGHAAGPPGAPTVLLYSHYDVQPPFGEENWDTPAWQLTERAGRWYGRGAADCKGNIVMHLTALRALLRQDGGFPCSVTVVCEGSQERDTDGLTAFVRAHADLLRADAIVVADTGNSAVGVPTLTTTLRGLATVDVRLTALAEPVHSGRFGGPVPDPVLGLIRLLATLHDEHGNTTVDGVDGTGSWTGASYPADRFRVDAGVLGGVELIGCGAVADLLWARPAATVLGLDVPPVAGSTAAVQASATARVSLQHPPGTTAREAQDALVAHLRSQVPWGLRCELTRVATGDPFVGSLHGPAFGAMRSALAAAYDHPMTTAGLGGSIPLCTVLGETFPDAEIMLLGVAEPGCRVHAPNESVDPGELERTALAEALFLRRYASVRRARIGGHLRRIQAHRRGLQRVWTHAGCTGRPVTEF